MTLWHADLNDPENEDEDDCGDDAWHQQQAYDAEWREAHTMNEVYDYVAQKKVGEETEVDKEAYAAGVSGRPSSENPYDKQTQADMHADWSAQWEQGAQVRAEVAAGA